MTGSAWGKAGSVHMDAGSARSQDRTSRERGCSARLGWRRRPPQPASWRLLTSPGGRGRTPVLGERRPRCNSDRDEERRPRRRWSSPSFGVPRHRGHASTSSIPPPLQGVDLARDQEAPVAVEAPTPVLGEAVKAIGKHAAQLYVLADDKFV